MMQHGKVEEAMDELGALDPQDILNVFVALRNPDTPSR